MKRTYDHSIDMICKSALAPLVLAAASVSVVEATPGLESDGANLLAKAEMDSSTDPAARAVTKSVQSQQLFSHANGRFSADIQNKSLEEVFGALGEIVPLQLHYKESVKGALSQEAVSVRFQDLSLPDALKRILRDMNYAFMPADEDRKHMTIYLLEGTGAYGILEAGEVAEPEAVERGSLPVTWSDEESGDWFEEATDGELVEVIRSAQDDRNRSYAVDLLGDRLQDVVDEGDVPDPSAIDALSYAMTDDTNAEIRTSALILLDSIDVAPYQLISSMATGDSNPEVRERAIQVLSWHHGEDAVGAIEEIARLDPDPTVRARAEGELVRLRKRLASQNAESSSNP